MKKNKPKESTSLKTLGVFIFAFIVVRLFYFMFGWHGFLDQQELKKAKSYYDTEQQQLIKIVCRDSSFCWRNEEQILRIAEKCRDDIDCWKHQKEQKILQIAEKCGDNVYCLARENGQLIF
jgi:hypothetical protein